MLVLRFRYTKIDNSFVTLVKILIIILVNKTLEVWNSQKIRFSHQIFEKYFDPQGFGEISIGEI